MKSPERIAEARAAETLLDERLKIYIPAPWLLRRMGKKTLTLRYRLPTGAQLLKMSAMFVRMNVDLKALEGGEAGVLFEHIARHVLPCSRIIARGLIRSGTMAFFFEHLLAGYLLRHMDMLRLAELTKLIVYLSSGENFASIIRSLACMKMTSPVLSQEETGS